MVPRTYLRQGLDRDVHQVITRLLERDDAPEVLTVNIVYEHIRRSNSSLKRKGKPLLEDSIEKALSSIQADQEGEDSELDDVPQDDIPISEERDASNAMNRSIMKSMKKRAAQESTPKETAGTPARDVNGDTQSKKRKEATSDTSKERPVKKPRWKEAPSTEPPTHVTLADFGGVENFIEAFKENIRQQILKAQTRNSQLSADIDFAVLAKMTPGFVGADLESLVFKAGAAFIARHLNTLDTMASHETSAEISTTAITPMPDDTSDIDMEGTLVTSRSAHLENVPESVAIFRKLDHFLLSEDQNILDTSSTSAITMADFLAALPDVQPSAKREGFATVPETTWANIGALTHVRTQLQECIVEPIKHPQRYEHLGIAAPAGVLLWGPPGCGKTLLAKAVANESKANFISVKGPELLNKYVGESERAVRQVFFRARSSTPCVIFFDELDALVPKRDAALSEASSRVVNTLLTELDGLGGREGIYVIAATNRPDTIDPAMLRPGRLGKHLFVGLPGPEERVEILRTIVASKPVRGAGQLEAMVALARECDKFSGADLTNLVYEAALIAAKSDAKFLELDHMVEARKGVKPSVGQNDLRDYGEWNERL
ncbi:hypothetical protein FH972_022091 [Carpinus fangiana]|uniref:AAA+ ATPase domain-containing protein n=1 Tax=Carpinus fangiana TaxID=176857 RepID=A0A5N6KR82_9ROSI|nr:hypothetical protein FH972_022091 [Carpinus fangiana]